MKASEIIKAEAERGVLAHAYLLLGSDRARADEFVRSLISLKKCLREDVVRLDPVEADGKLKEIGVELVRDILHQASLSPHGECKIIIIHHAEKLNQSSSNILLKSLEEPPRAVTFVLVAYSDTLLSTIKSRCRLVRIRGNESHIAAGEEAPLLLKQSFHSFSSEMDKIIKEGGTQEFLLGIENYLRAELNDRRDKKFVIALENVLEARRKLNQNVAPRLAMEVMALKLKKIIKGINPESQALDSSNEPQS